MFYLAESDGRLWDFPSLSISPTPGSEMKRSRQGERRREELTRTEEKNRLVFFFANVVIWLLFWDISGPDEINYGAAVWRSEKNILLWGKIIKKKQQGEMFVDVCFVSVNLLF